MAVAVALAQLEGSSDEAKLAGLLLLSRCSPPELAQAAPRATLLLIGAASGEAPNAKERPTAPCNFLKRLLLTPAKSPAAPSPQPTAQHSSQLSSMQLLDTMAPCDVVPVSLEG